MDGVEAGSGMDEAADGENEDESETEDIKSNCLFWPPGDLGCDGGRGTSKPGRTLRTGKYYRTKAVNDRNSGENLHTEPGKPTPQHLSTKDMLEGQITIIGLHTKESESRDRAIGAKPLRSGSCSNLDSSLCQRSGVHHLLL